MFKQLLPVPRQEGETARGLRPLLKQGLIVAIRLYVAVALSVALACAVLLAPFVLIVLAMFNFGKPSAKRRQRGCHERERTGRVMVTGRILLFDPPTPFSGITGSRMNGPRFSLSDRRSFRI